MRLWSKEFAQALKNSLRPLHSAIMRRVPTRYGRHRSLYACRVTNPLETKRSCSMRPVPAFIGRVWPYLDVEAHVSRPPDTLQIDVEQPTDARRALSEIGILELLGHGASQPDQTNHADAKNTCGSELRVTGDDIRLCEHLRGGVRWMEAHRMRRPRQRHGKALLAAHTHVCDITWVFGIHGRAHT